LCRAGVEKEKVGMVGWFNSLIVEW